MIIDAAAEQALLEWPFFQQAITHGASDLHLCVGHPPSAQIHGLLEKFDAPPLTADDLNNIFQLVADRQLRGEFFGGHSQDLDYTVELTSLKRRMRLNIFKQYNGLSIVMRVLSERIKTFDELGLPKTFENLSFEKSGLVLVTGGTGSGKSTTLASMVELINQKQKRHIITIEDPIEIVFDSKQALVEQREIGTHVPDFRTALRSAMRESPHVILVGEIRDAETAAMTLRAAQIGALIMATLHTRSAGETVSRYLSLFEDNWRNSARTQLADALRGVMCQQLIPIKSGGGRVAACEVLVGTTASRHLIREDKGHLLHSIMEIASNDGMLTMEQSLFNLFNEGKVDLQVGYDNSNDKQAFLSQLPPDLQKELTIDWETEVEIQNLEKIRDTQKRKAAVRHL